MAFVPCCCCRPLDVGATQLGDGRVCVAGTSGHCY
jgi:hypothetical protein